MPIYKLSHIHGGKFSRTETTEARDDATAVQWAEQRIGDDPAELWCEARKVEFFEARRDSS